jgi:ABC-type transport system involved in multi-copper enzyme maturation permease subunit
MYKALFWNTFQKEYRNKTLLILGVVTLLLIFAVNWSINIFFENVELEYTKSFIGERAMSVLFIFISNWMVFLSVIMGTNAVKSDLEDKLLPVMLSFPLKRRDYLLIRILGTSSVLFSYYLISFILGLILMSYNVEMNLLGPRLLMAPILGPFIIVPTVTISVLFSLYFNKLISFILSSIFLFLVNISNGQSALSFLGPKDSGILPEIMNYLFPRVGRFSEYLSNILWNGDLPDGVLWDFAHFFGSMPILFLLLNFCFKRKEA